jgi:phospholipase D1/2
VVCGLPPARLSATSLRGILEQPAAEQFITSLLGDRLTEIIDELNGIATSDALRVFADSPGLWQWIRFDPPTKDFVAQPDAPTLIAPVVHHVKLTLVDTELAILGGSNVTPALHDDVRHRARPLGTHDLNVAVRGGVVADLHRIFAGLWNDAGPLAEATMLAYRTHRSAAVPALPAVGFTAATPAPVRIPAPRPSTATAQAVRTATGPITDPAADSGEVPQPQGIRRDTEEAMRAAIAGAQEYIYLENQYFRWPDTGRWLRDALAATPELTLIVVIPLAPEEGDDPLTVHGIGRERELIMELTAAAPARVGFYTLEAPVAAAPGRPTAFGGREVYVHSKTMIVDDRFALIGSANINGRAFRVDTELGIAWHDRTGVRKLRERLWRHLLGDAGRALTTAPARDFRTVWETIAWANTATPPRLRTSFVVPRLPGPPPRVNPLLEQLRGPPDTGLIGRLRRAAADRMFEQLTPLFDVYASTADEPGRPADPPSPPLTS